jgi:hypothetical protein
MMDRTTRAGVDPDQDSIAEEATGDRDKNSPPPALGHGWIMDGSNQTSS